MNDCSLAIYLLLPLELPGLLDQLLGLQLPVPRVVARVGPQAAALQVPDLGRHRVEEIPVVGDDDEGVAGVAEKVLQPGEPLEVEVVGRLVEDEQVWVAEQSAGERGPGELAAARRRGRVVQRPGVQPDAGRDALHAALVVVAADGLVPGQQCGVAALGVAARPGDLHRGVGDRPLERQ